MPIIYTPFSPSFQAAFQNALIGMRELLYLTASSKITAIGDSITDDGFQTAAESASTIGPTSRGWDSWARFNTGQQFDWVNQGVSGDNIEDVEARVGSIPADTDLVIVEVGGNNAGESEAVIQGRYLSLSSAFSVGGFDNILWCTIPVRSSGPWTQGTLDKMLAINEWLKKTFRFVVEVNTTFEDGSNRPDTGMTTDGTHLTQIGGYTIGRNVGDAITVVGSRTITGTVKNTGPTLTGTKTASGTGISGTIATDYIISRTSSTGTVVATANQPGVTLVFSGGSGVGTEEWLFRTASINITVTADNEHELDSQIDISDWDGWRHVTLRLYEVGVTSNYDMVNLLDDASFPFPEGGAVGLLRTSTHAVVGTTLRAFLEIGVDPDATGTGTISITNYSLLDTT